MSMLTQNRSEVETSDCVCTLCWQIERNQQKALERRPKQKETSEHVWKHEWSNLAAVKYTHRDWRTASSCHPIQLCIVQWGNMCQCDLSFPPEGAMWRQRELRPKEHRWETAKEHRAFLQIRNESWSTDIFETLFFDVEIQQFFY